MINFKYLIFISILISLLIIPVYGLQIKNGDGSISVSNGDTITIIGNINDTSQYGYAWVYTGNYDTLIYGEPINISDKKYTVIINQSKHLQSGKYKLFIEFAGKNNIQEVIFDKNTSKLYSPWRYPKTIDVSGTISSVPNMIEQFCKDNIAYCDDTFINQTITVEGPFIKFSEQYQTQHDEKDITKNGLLYVGGTTNLDPSNKINVTLDYIQTTTAIINQTTPYDYYHWHAYLNISKLRSGDHTILIQSNKVADLKSILTIGEYIPTPTPTPTPVKYVRNEMKEFVSVTNTPNIRVTPTPIIVNNTNQQFVPIVSKTPTPTPTTIIQDTPRPAPANAVYIVPTETNQINYIPSTPSNTKLPIPHYIPILGILLTIFIINRKR